MDSEGGKCDGCQCYHFTNFVQQKLAQKSIHTRIVRKGRLWLTSFIYKYKTSTTYPLYETTWCFILINKWCLWVKSTKPTICLFPQSHGYDQKSNKKTDGNNNWAMVLTQLTSCPQIQFKSNHYQFLIKTFIYCQKCDQIKIAKCL